MKSSDFHRADRVAYIPGEAYKDGKPDMQHPNIERGSVSSTNDKYVFVKFDKQVSKLGWDGTTSQSCSPDDLLIENVLTIQEDFL